MTPKYIYLPFENFSNVNVLHSHEILSFYKSWLRRCLPVGRVGEMSRVGRTLGRNQYISPVVVGLSLGEDMKGHALFYLVPVTLIYLSSTEGLTLEKTADLGDDTTEVPQDDSIADNVVRVKNGIRFENGVLKYDILTSSTVGPDESEKIVFDYEVEALKVMEMLTGDDSNSSSPLFQSGNVTIEEYHSYKQMQIFARDIASQYPDLVANYSLGKSVQGRELIAFKIRFGQMN